MRPDKKKTRHHDSVKCEQKAKAKAAEKAKKDDKAQTQKKKQNEQSIVSFLENETENQFYKYTRLAKCFMKGKLLLRFGPLRLKKTILKAFR